MRNFISTIADLICNNLGVFPICCSYYVIWAFKCEKLPKKSMMLNMKSFLNIFGSCFAVSLLVTQQSIFVFKFDPHLDKTWPGVTKIGLLSHKSHSEAWILANNSLLEDTTHLMIESAGGETWTSNPLIPSQTLYQLSSAGHLWYLNRMIPANLNLHVAKMTPIYSKTCVKRPLKNRQKILNDKW